uniref:Uncharacterized protein n=1 Tax=Cacopsylla melanoneura TaxID=428564 RepID=A0A8D8LQ89_9HEMI
MSGMSTACSPSLPMVPPRLVTINRVPTLTPLTLVSVTMILRQGGQALAISNARDLTLVMFIRANRPLSSESINGEDWRVTSEAGCLVCGSGSAQRSEFEETSDSISVSSIGVTSSLAAKGSVTLPLNLEWSVDTLTSLGLVLTG